MARPPSTPAKDRGRAAESPVGIPLVGWKDIALRVKDAIGRDNISIVAAGVAFFVLIALFPAIAALVALYGLIASPADVAAQMEAVSGMLPPEAQGIVEQQLTSAAEAGTGAMTLGALAGLGLALWGASRGTQTLIIALNIAYDEEDDRTFIRRALLSIVMTLGAFVLVGLAVVLIAVVPTVLAMVDLGPLWTWLISLVRWPILFLMALTGLGAVYRYAPNRSRAQWRWSSPGAVIAALLWIIGSLLFSFYVSNFGGYQQTYGVLAGVVVLMLWLYLTAMVILIGAEINVEMERQTRHDTTSTDRPMGERGAHGADTLGETSGGDAKTRK